MFKLRSFVSVACTLLSVFCVFPVSSVLPVSAQVLARPGWAGSGISTDLWWRHAIVYHVDVAGFSPAADGTPLHGVAQRLDYIHTLGVDALLLTPIQTDATHAQSIAPSLGTLDDLDDLIHEASRRNMRVLLDLDPAIPAADMPNVARFWLNRGVAGFHVAGRTDAAQAAVLRKAAASYVGQRILIMDAPTAVAATEAAPPPPLASDTRGRHHAHARSLSATASQPTTLDSSAPQLLLDPRAGTVATLSAGAVRPAIEATEAILQTGHTLPLLATDGPAYVRSMKRYANGQNDLAIAKVLATLLLATRGDALLFYGQELGVSDDTAAIDWGPVSAGSVKAGSQETGASAEAGAVSVAAEDADGDSLLRWYRQLGALHHDNPAVANGANITLNHDDQDALVWVRRPQTVSANAPALVVICNLSEKPVELNLKPDMQRIQLRGSFLRTLMRSDGKSGPMHLESIQLAPYAVYIGELRY